MNDWFSWTLSSVRITSQVLAIDLPGLKRPSFQGFIRRSQRDTTSPPFETRQSSGSSPIIHAASFNDALGATTRVLRVPSTETLASHQSSGLRLTT